MYITNKLITNKERKMKTLTTFVCHFDFSDCHFDDTLNRGCEKIVN